MIPDIPDPLQPVHDYAMLIYTPGLRIKRKVNTVEYGECINLKFGSSKNLKFGTSGYFGRSVTSFHASGVAS